MHDIRSRIKHAWLIAAVSEHGNALARWSKDQTSSMKQIEARHRCGAGNLAGESPEIRARLQANGAVQPMLQLVLAATGQPGLRVLSTAFTAAWALSSMLQDSSTAVSLWCCAVYPSLLTTSSLLVASCH